MFCWIFYSSIIPKQKKINAFMDYLTKNYINFEAKCVHSAWAWHYKKYIVLERQQMHVKVSISSDQVDTIPKLYISTGGLRS